MFPYNLEFFKYYSNINFICLKTTSGENFCKNWAILWGVMAETPSPPRKMGQLVF